MINMVMSENLPVNERSESFVGSMKGTMEIVDVKWEADAERPSTS